MFQYQGSYTNQVEDRGAPIPQGIYEENSVAQGQVGTIRRVGGRTFVYSKAGGTALGIGMLAIQPTPTANHQNVVAAAIVPTGAREVTVTLGATLATLNQYADGYLVISDADSEGTAYKIRSNPAAASGASLTLTLWDAVHTALAVTSECCLIPAPYNGTVIAVTDQADVPAGIPIIAVTADYYYWSQTGGICPAWADENVTQGERLVAGTSVAGSVEADDAAGEPVIGLAYIALVDDEFRPIYLTILE